MRITMSGYRGREVRGARKSDYIAKSVFDESIAITAIGHHGMRPVIAN
jgi:hypothetical protein